MTKVWESYCAPLDPGVLRHLVRGETHVFLPVNNTPGSLLKIDSLSSPSESDEDVKSDLAGRWELAGLR